MKEKHNIEDLFRTKLGDYKQEPPKELWNRIANETSGSSSNFQFKRKPFLFGLAIVVVGISALFLLSENQNSNAKQILETNTENGFMSKPAVLAGFETEKSTATITTPGNSIDNTIRVTIPKTKIVRTTTTTTSTNSSANDKQTTKQIETKTTVSLPVADKVILNSTQNISKNAAQILAVDFMPAESCGCAPFTVELKNNSLNAETFEWDFGNGIKSSLRNPIVTFETAGIYPISLTAFAGGISKVHTLNITVNQAPEADFIIDTGHRLFAGQSVTFANLSNSNQKSTWNFGDGTTSNKMHPKHTFSQSGIYDISLVVTDDNGCKNTYTKQNIIIVSDIYKIDAPTAFVPDPYGANDGCWERSTNKNQIFFPIFQSEISQYKLRIFSRTGMQIFESTEPTVGWNGYYKNRLSAYDVYVWECYGKFEDGEPFHETGNVTLIRSK